MISNLISVISARAYEISPSVGPLETDKVIDYLQNLLEYDSSRDAYLKFQNGGNGACSCEAGLLDEKP